MCVCVRSRVKSTARMGLEKGEAQCGCRRNVGADKAAAAINLAVQCSDVHVIVLRYCTSATQPVPFAPAVYDTKNNNYVVIAGLSRFRGCFGFDVFLMV